MAHHHGGGRPGAGDIVPVHRLWRTLLLALLVALGVLIGTLMDRGGWAAVKDFFASIFQKR